MKILLLAPRTSLPLADEEVQNVIRSGLDVSPRLGTIRHSDLVRDIVDSDADILWLITHGTAEGTYFSDGLVSNSLLSNLIGERFKTVVLNTCSSIEAAMSIQNNTNADVICTIGEVEDRDAYQFGTLFARALVKYGDVEAAYNAVKPEGYKYLYLTSNRALNRKMNSNETTELIKTISELTQAVYRLEYRMTTLEKIVDRISDHEKRILKLESQPADGTHVPVNIFYISLLSVGTVAAMFFVFWVMSRGGI